MADRPTLTQQASRVRVGATALTASLALAVLAAAPALAASSAPPTTAFSLTPLGTSGAMLFHGVPGRVLDETVVVRNLTAHRISVRLQPAEIEDASNGNAAYVTRPLAGAGRWLHLSSSSVRLAAHAVKHVTFTVRIPKGATGASYYAGIVGVNRAALDTGGVRHKGKGGAFTFRRIDRQALPLTLRLPGKLSRHLALQSVKLRVQPGGAVLVLRLLPGGSELIESASVKLDVRRGAHSVFTYSAVLGQLFPHDRLDYHVPWKGRPTTGTYRVDGVIRPKGAASVDISRTVKFTAATAKQLTDQTGPATAPAPSGMASWVWIALGGAALLLILLLVVVYKLARRPAAQI